MCSHPPLPPRPPAFPPPPPSVSPSASPPPARPPPHQHTLTDTSPHPPPILQVGVGPPAGAAPRPQAPCHPPHRPHQGAPSPDPGGPGPAAGAAAAAQLLHRARRQQRRLVSGKWGRGGGRTGACACLDGCAHGTAVPRWPWCHLSCPSASVCYPSTNPLNGCTYRVRSSPPLNISLGLYLQVLDLCRGVRRRGWAAGEQRRDAGPRLPAPGPQVGAAASPQLTT